jgi:hypothetical protein
MGTHNATMLALACSLLGCGTGDPASDAAEDESLSPVAVRLGRGVDGNGYALASDGYVEFYSGDGIADLVESGEIAHDSTHPYLMLRVPSEVVDTAARRAERVVSASMEDASNDLAVTIHRPGFPVGAGDASTSSAVVHAGDPDVFGFVQVVIAEDGRAMGLIDLTVVHRFPSGVVAPNYYTTGTVPASDIPEQSDANPRLADPQGG